VDRIPKDLAGMRSTGISAFAYPRLIAALGLPPRLPKVYDTWQMLALPDRDVLDALGVDVITVEGLRTNAFEQPEQWVDYDFNGRLPARVPKDPRFEDLADGTIVQNGNARMVPAAYVFDSEHAGQPLCLDGDLPRIPIEELHRQATGQRLTPEEVAGIRDVLRRVRAATDRAVFFAHGKLYGNISIGAQHGLAVFPLLCLTEQEYVREVHEIQTQRVVDNLRALLPEIRGLVDVLLMSADDWGTQNALIAPPWVYAELFQPYFRRMNDEAHRLAPDVKTFLHSCGAVYEGIPTVADCGFDILNPVQWSAGGHTPAEWKARAMARRLSLWGGGVNSQATLPLGRVSDIEAEVRRTVSALAAGGGYVFCNIHNILAEVEPAKVIAMYRAAE
jgi:uroporphyrinogen decarboxylase